MTEIAPLVTLDWNTLREVGLGALSPKAGNRVLHVAYANVLYGFSARLLDAMTEEQQAEYDSYFYAGDQSGACRFITENVAGYKVLLALELADLMARLREDAPAILAIETTLDDCAEHYDRRFADVDDPEAL